MNKDILKKGIITKPPKSLEVEIKGAKVVTLKGDKGEKGEKGDVTADGVVIIRGDKGEKGEKGDKGEQGKEGKQGIKGIQGEKGDTGEKGDKGESGNDGKDGKDGSPDTSEQILEKLNPLKNALNFEVLTNIPDFALSSDVVGYRGGGGGGGQQITFQDEGVNITSNPILKFNVTGSGGSLAYSGNGVATLDLTGGGTVGPGTENEIAYFDTTTSIASLTVATYPSLTELSYVKGVTSAIQTQINTKAPTTSPTFATSITGSYLTASEILITDGSKNIVSAAVATYPSLTELTYVKGLTSSAQTQLTARALTATTITIAGTANQITSSAGAQDLSANRTWTLSLPSDVIIPTVLTVPNTGLHLLDTNASHDLIIAPGSDLTADHTLTLTTGDADRTITLSGNPTLSDWFDQSVKTTANPTFGNLTITSFAANWTNAGRTVADLGIVTTVDINGGTIDGVTIGGASAGAITGTTIDATTDFTIGTTVITDDTIVMGTTGNLLNTVSTTVNAFGATTTLNIGASATCILNFGGGATASEFRYLEPSGSGTNYTAFKAQAQAASVTYTLPNAVGGAGTFLKDAAGDGVLSWATPAGSGDVTKVGTPVNNQVGVWTGDGTLEGDSALTFDTTTNLLTTDLITANTNFTVGGTVITNNTITDDGTLIIAATTATSFSDGNITNVGDIALDSLTADATNINLNSPLQLTENAPIMLDPAGSADGKYSGITVAGTAGATLAFGDLIYLDPTDSRWELCDANAASAADGDSRGTIGICVLAAAADGSATTILLQGIVRADAAFPALTINAPLYVSETAGDIVVTQPTTADVVIRVVGFALTADEIYFNPAGTYITHN